jgi:hypothetical protein
MEFERKPPAILDFGGNGWRRTGDMRSRSRRGRRPAPNIGNIGRPGRRPGCGGEPEKRGIERANPIWPGTCYFQKRLSSLDLGHFRPLARDLTIRHRRISCFGRADGGPGTTGKGRNFTDTIGGSSDFGPPAADWIGRTRGEARDRAQLRGLGARRDIHLPRDFMGSYGTAECAGYFVLCFRSCA